jgi:hypothetical protein
MNIAKPAEPSLKTILSSPLALGQISEVINIMPKRRADQILFAQSRTGDKRRRLFLKSYERQTKNR